MAPCASRWTRRLILTAVSVWIVVSLPYAVIGWRYTTAGDAFLLDYTATTAPDVPAATVVVSVVDVEGRPVSRGEVFLLNTSGGASGSLDSSGHATISLGEPEVLDIEFGTPKLPAGRRPWLNSWVSHFYHGGFRVTDQGVRLNIRLRWRQPS